ncbi:hypothetical protein FT663_05418 [Candidozyma haemuli var. vulneris]|uniref:LYC1 C-terminal domain-containing protein n=1 Tax=Candidozyma haemuli TaxID=45357 RepID=A0A2V1AZK7_9ASCO|nr:hypothetical protein CXQ85_003790 [[Candida] haemuloni]KAF3985141.1 hypothetical protein FT663_05418 [[Candida] haemuloni var. vulneris]KAF3985427.1 hypothetical protein FT662_05148 [[Candida] haemuloni var. vulneris]PVH23500.1 hypothetical protein CXQ85_003790 [[Candida] haemuloni]
MPHNAEEYYLDRLHDSPSINHTRTKNAQAWKNLLPEQEYVEREFLLSKAKITSSKVNRLCVFALKNKSSGSVVSSMELLIRQAWRFKKENGAVSMIPVLSGCIGAVYTYPEYRGNGFAAMMVKKCMDEVRCDEYLGTNGFTFLYSEIGEYYANHGFKSFEVPLTNIPLSPSNEPLKLPPGASLVEYHNFGYLFAHYRDHFAAQMRSKVNEDGIERISVVPTADFVDWFHLRAKFLSTRIFGHDSAKFDVWNDSYEHIVGQFEDVEPKHFGIRLDCPETGKHIGFIVWTYDYDYSKEEQHFHNHATVLKIHVNTPDFDRDTYTAQLVDLAKRYLESPHKADPLKNFTSLIVWESELSNHTQHEFVKKYGADSHLENSSRSAIMYNNDADDDKLKSGNMVWENNTKLPWF